MKNIILHRKLITSHWKWVLFLIINFWVGSISLSAQVACPSADTLLAKWDFSKKTAPCEGATPGYYGIQHPLLAQNAYAYCPSESAGCGNARLGSRGHGNTGWFANAICLLNFYDLPKTKSRPNVYFPSDYDASSTVFDPEGKANLYVEYKIPKGELGCLTEFSLQFLQKQYRGTIGFETQGVAIKKNGIIVYQETQAIQASNVNGDNITFPLDVPGLCSDGTQDVTFEVIFGLVHQLTYAVVGYDNVCLRGSCGPGSATGSAEVATCGPGGGNNGQLKLSGFADGEKFDWVEGTTYTGSATYATATTVPSSGILVDTIGIKSLPTAYTIRLFRPDCHLDAVVVMPPTFCPYSCDWPTADIEVVPATCSGMNVNDDAAFTVTNIVNADRIGISVGKTYTGPDYDDATVIVGASMAFDNMENPECLEYYTIRLFNGAEDEEQCINDVTLVLSPTSCDGCTIICAQVESSVAVDTVSANDDAAKATACKTNFFVDLELDKTVSPSSGLACNTDFEFTLTLSNTGTMTATDITVVDLLAVELTYISSSATIGTFTQGGGWYLDSLDANETAVLTITAIAKKAGTFSNCTFVDNFYPQNDPDSSPDNTSTANEDDDDCVSFTVNGPSPPLVRKTFSPEYTRPNFPTRLTLTFTNYEDTPIELTSDFIDSLPADGANQMVVATTPNLSSPIAGVVATAGANTITLPSGSILPVGVSNINIDIIAPADGTYVNGFGAGQLITNIGANCEPDSADLYVDALNVLAPQITKTLSASMIEPNQVSLLTITLTNNNAASLELITDFIDYFPSGLKVATSGTNSGTCAGLVAFSAGDSTLVLPTGSIIPSGSCTIIVPVTSSVEGEHCNVVGLNALVGLVDGSMAGNEDRSEACLKVVNNPIYDLALRKSLSPNQADSVTVGSTISYDITVLNQGTRAGTDIQITDYIPDGLSLVADTIWQMSNGNAILVNPIANLDPGAETTISIQFTIDINYQGNSIINSAEIMSTNEGTDEDSTPDNIENNDKGGKAKSPTDDVVLGNAKLAGGTPQDENGLTDEDDADPAIIYLKTETIENCAVVLSLDPQNCNTSDNTYSVNGSINFSNAPTTGDLIVVVDGDTTQTINAPFTSPQALSLTGLNSDGQNHTVVAKFTTGGSCQTSLVYAAPSPCLATSTCSVATTANAGTCEMETNTYEVTGAITFTDAPASGTLTVAIGGFQQTFAAPFTSPQNYTLTDLVADGSTHTVVVSFSDDVACSDVTDYIAPGGCDPVACGATLSVTPSTCAVGTNTFDLTGSVTFTNAPTTGNLVIEVGGDTITFAAPFTSPQAFTINDLIASGQTGQATAYFSDDAICTAMANFDAPVTCSPSVCAVSMELTPSPCADGKYILNGTVNFVNPTTTGTLKVREGGTVYLDIPLPLSSPISFTIPDLAADSASHTLQVSFSDDLACANDFTYMAPGSCSGSCALSGMIADVECRDNGTGSENNDDYTIFSLNPIGTNLGGSYSVTSDAGTVYRLSGSVATNVPYGATTVFRLINGSADEAEKMINIIDDANPDCTEALMLTAPISCSCKMIEETIDTAICSNETYQFDGQNLNIAGTYRDSLKTAFNCDSIIVLNLAILPTAETAISEEICNGTSYDLNGQSLTTAGTYRDTIPAANGCDSIIILTLDILNAITGLEFYNGCKDDGYSVVVGSTTYNQNNPTGMETLTAANGCDSIVTVSLVYKSTTTGMEVYDGCQGDGYEVVVGATTYNETNPTGTETVTGSNGCDSVVTVNLVFKPNATGTTDYDGCEGDGYEIVVGATTYNEGNPTGSETLDAANGCDSVVTVNLVFKPNATGTADYDGCQGDGYEVVVGATTYNEGNPTGIETLDAANGCDSVVTVNLVFKPNATGTADYDGCEGDGYEIVVGTTTYNEGNPTGTETLGAADGCDSIVTVNLVYKPNTTGTEDYDGCEGDGYSVVVGTTTYNEVNPSGTETLTSATGCDSVVTVNLVFKPSKTGAELYDGCEGDGYSVVVGSTTFNEANPAGMVTLTAADGCDSVVTVSLVYKINSTGTLVYDGCQDDGYEVVVGSTTYNEANPTGTETILATNGCDSLVTINLVYKPTVTGLELYDGCMGDGYEKVIGSTTYSEANPSGMETLTSAIGCDSVVTVSFVYKANTTGTEIYDGCEGDGYEVVVGSTTYNENNTTGTETLTAANGCDSVVTISLAYKPNSTGVELYDGCMGDGYEKVIGSTTYNETNPSGMSVLTAANGCDSVVTVSFVYKANTTGTEDYDGCQDDGYSVVVGSTTYDEGNPSGMETLTAANGCDSVVTVNLVFKPNATGTAYYDGCEGDGYSVVVGSTTYDEGNPSGMETLSAANGCDSVVTINLVYKSNVVGIEAYEGCEGDDYSVVVGTTTYNEVNPSGMETLTAARGCDSVVTVNLVFKPNTTGIELYNGCIGDGYEVVVGTTTYNEANPSGMETLTAANGCDSIVTVGLVFKSNTTGIETYNGCQNDGYSVIVGSTIYNETNPSGTETLTSANGCDSIVTIDLTYREGVTGLEFYAGCQGDGYEVVVGTTTYNEANPFGMETLSAADNCDSVVTVSLVYKGRPTGEETYVGCQGDGYEVIVGSTTYNEANPTGTETFPVEDDCDSLVTINLVFNPTKTGAEVYNGCEDDGYSVTVGSTVYNEINPSGMETLTAADGCDSVVTVALIFKPNATGTETYVGCEGDGYEVVVGAMTYNETSRTGMETLTAANGCDSVVTVNLVFKPNATGTETYEGCEGDGYEVIVSATTYNEGNPTGSEILTAANGCDSLVTVQLAFYSEKTGMVSYEGCFNDGYEVVVGATTYNEGNPTGSETLTAASGCDSIVTVNLVFNPKKTSMVAYEGCEDDGYSVTVGTIEYNEGNPTGSETLIAASGCDSTVTVNLVFNPKKTSTVTYEGCEDDGYSVTVGTAVYNETNPIGTEILTTANGCDSTVTINLVFKPNLIGLVAYEGCEDDGYSVTVGATEYNESNPIGTETLTATNGCDSTVTINLVFKPNSTGLVAYEGCEDDGYSVMVGATEYNEGNPTGIEILTAANGCDSTVTINLLFKPNATDLVTYEGCEDDGYNVTVGATEYNEANPIGTEILTAANGCDSTVTVNLVFNPKVTSIIAYEGCEKDGYNVTVGTTVYDETNPTGTEILTAANGCDSTVMVNLVFNPEKASEITYNGCTDDGYEVVVNGTLYSEENPVGTEVFMTDKGCDSIVTIRLDFKSMLENDCGVFDLALEKSTESTTVRLGDLVTYQIKVTNEGTVDAYNINITDFIPEGMSLADNNWTVEGDKARFNLPISYLPVENSFTIYITLKVDLDFIGTSLVNFAEITSADDDDDPDNTLPTDADSTPDDDSTNPDEDDDDSAVVRIVEEGTDVFDLALIETLAPGQEMMVRPGEVVDFKITILNQGTLPAETIEITQYLPTGLTLNPTNLQGWTSVNDTSATKNVSLPTGGLAPDSMVMVMIQVIVSEDLIEGKLTAYAEISDDGDNEDVDSTPNGDRTDDTGGVPNSATDNTTDQIPPTDEDDSDPVQIMLQQFDLALTEELLTEGSVGSGDSITGKIKVFNQGEISADNIKLFTYIPAGLQLDDERWVAMDDSTAMLTLSVANNDLPAGGLTPEEMTMITIGFTIDPTFMDTCLITYAEIGSATDENGNATNDVDSTPDGDPTNDTGGEVHTPTDNQIFAAPPTDEDDHDPMKIVVEQTFDLALEKSTDSMLVRVGDLVTYQIQITNEGSLDAYNIGITDYLPDGMSLQDNNWTNYGDTLRYNTPISFLGTGQSTIIEIVLQVNSGVENRSLMNFAEISSADDDTNPDNEPPVDEDSIPDEDKTNEDEDDDDTAVVTVIPPDVFDLAIVETLAPSQSGMARPGETIDFKITVFNQGNISADTIKLIQYLPADLTLNSSNPQGWIAMNDSTAMLTLTAGNGLPVGGLVGDNMVMVMIQTVVSDTPSSKKLTAYAEISADGQNEDIDSTPDDDRTNDVGGMPNTDSDDTYDQIPPMDEDDHDPVQIMLQEFDLAITEELITEGEVETGDSITGKIKVFNQGDIPADNIKIMAYIPEGLILTDAAWIIMDDSTAMRTLSVAAGEIPTGGLQAEEMMMVTIDFIIDPNFMEDCLITYAEIGDATDENGTKVMDVDSTPDGDRTNDTGGVVDSPTDNEIDETSPTDEDDHDPMKITVTQTFDLALIIELAPDQKIEVPDNDTVCFNITVINQGTQDAYDIGIVNYVPLGLTYDAALNQQFGVNWQADSTFHLDELFAGDTAVIPIKFISNMETMDSIVVDTAEIYFATTENGGTVNTTDIDSHADDDNQDFIGGDNLTDNHLKDEDDHDYVYIVPLGAVDPIGYIYADKTGKIIKGGTISVTTPPGGIAFIIEDGSSGMYQWFTNGVQGEYVMTYTHPDGLVISPNCNAQTDVYDPTGRDGDASDRDGDGTNGVIQLGTIGVNSNTTHLLNPTCSDNPYYLRFFLQSGDPIIDGNNIAIQESFIGSIVCEDTNGNGQSDEGEPGIPNALVYLYTCSDTINPIASTVTDAQGAYKFEALNAGDYMVQFIVPDGYRLPVDATPANAIAERGGFSECINLTTGQCDTTTACMKACTEIVATVSANTIREGESVTISLDGGPDFIWSANTGITNTTTSTATFFPTTTTTYTVTVEDTYGCSETLDITITVIPRVQNFVRIADPCNCTTEEINNTPAFDDRITIYSLFANENWTISKNEGIYDNGTLTPLGKSFTAGGKIGLYYTYTMEIQHLDATGYVGMFTNGTETLSADNICFSDQSCNTIISTDSDGTPGIPVTECMIMLPVTTTPHIDTLKDCSGCSFRSDGSEDNTLYADTTARNNVITICAETPWQTLLATFSQFDLAAGDTLYVFEGRDTISPLIGKFSGAGVSQTGGWVGSDCKPSVNPYGCLTFQFKTNGNNGKSLGWRATMTCSGRDIELTPPNDLSAKATCTEISKVFTINPATIKADCGTVQDSQIVRIYNPQGDICKDTCLAFDKNFQLEVALGSYRVEYKLKSDSTKTTEAILSVQAPSLVCNDEITVPLGSGCSVTLTPDDLLENDCDTIPNTMYYYITIEYIDENGKVQTVTGGGKGGDYPTISKEMLGSCGGTVTATIERRYFENSTLAICNVGQVSASCSVRVNTVDQSTPVFTNFSRVDTFVTCAIDLTQEGLGLPTPEAIDNCGAATVTFGGAILTSAGSEVCDTSKVNVTWNAVDECGNITTATQQVVFVRPRLEDVVKTGKITLSCDSEITTEEITSVPGIKIGKLKNGILIPSDTIALSTETYTCGYILQKRDVEIPTVDCGKKIYRYWSVLDWCDTNEGIKAIDTTFIEYRDTLAPEFATGTGQNRVIELDHFSCTYDLSQLTQPEATDNCSEVNVRMDSVFRIENGQLWGVANSQLATLDCDSFQIRWVAEDACHEQLKNDTIAQIIEIKDLTAPSVVCTDKINLSLGQTMARLHYTDIDAGSYDACGIVKYEVSRDEENWDSVVIFDCNDVHAAVKVYLRVTDNKSNQSTCWMNVNIEDKIAPICSDLPDMTGSCDEGHGSGLVVTDTNDNGKMDEDEWIDLTPEQAADFNTKYGNPNCSDNVDCGSLVIEQQYQMIEKGCGIATIKRRYRAADWNGQGRVSNWSEQRIDIESKADWSITLPVDWEGTCGEIAPNSEVLVENGACDLLAYEVEEQVFTTTEEACSKVVRTFTIINWCKYQAGGETVRIVRVENEHGMVTKPVVLTAEGYENVGRLEYVQILKLKDETAPVITIAEVDNCLVGAECGDNKQFAITATDCNPATEQSLVYNWVISAGDTKLAQGEGAAFNYPVLPKTTYKVRWTVSDNCGNTASEKQTYNFWDCKKPSPYCLNGIAVELMPDAGVIQVWASDLELNSSDNCSSKDKLEFRIWHASLGEEPTQIAEVLALPEAVTFTCATLGTQTVNLYVIDEDNNWDYCVTYVVVQDNMNACKDRNEGMARVSGTIQDWRQQMVEEVEVQVLNSSSMMTKTDGHFDFELAMNENYTIRPEKNVNPLNGVSTFDLVLISKHILGIKALDNPYQLIAADVNSSGTITAFDMVQIRQLILNINTTFANSSSWKFVYAGYEFTTDTPMAEDYPQIAQITDLQQDVEMDFVAIKMGDVNGNARPSSLVQATDRTTTDVFEITTADKTLKAGETYTVTFHTEQLATIQGYQFTLGYENLKVEKLKSGVVSVENFGLHKMEKGMITTSWNQAIEHGKTTTWQHDMVADLFTIEFTALSDGKLSEQLSINNNPTAVEAYDENGELMEVQLTFTTPLYNDEFDLFQNQPNPFHDKTRIGFYLPGDSDVQLILRDETGRIIHTLKDSRPQGFNTLDLDKKHLTNGFIYYQLTTKFGTKSKKMLRIQ